MPFTCICGCKSPCSGKQGVVNGDLQLSAVRGLHLMKAHLFKAIFLYRVTYSFKEILHSIDQMLKYEFLFSYHFLQGHFERYFIYCDVFVTKTGYG